MVGRQLNFRLLVALAVLGGLLLPASAAGVTSLTQGFLIKNDAPLGSIVSLQKDSTDFVSLATASNVSNILGVVVGSDNSVLSLSSDQANQVQVATNGVVQVLVSSINGGIYVGDSITASPISGVGMKATSNTRVVGIAQQNLSNSSNSNKQTYTDSKHKKQTITVGTVPVLVNVTNFYKQPDKTIIPAAIQNVANAVAGKTVNTLPIVVSILIFVITIIVVASIIYAMIHSSIISVGRNPMSQSAIYRNLIQMSMLVLGIIGAALVSIYMVLAKF
jgi:hypothetical protein